MAWIPITDADVLKEFTPSENATLKNIQASTDNLSSITGDVAAEFRQAISDAGTSLGDTEDGHIPPGFRAHAVALARWRWLISIPQAKALQTEERRRAAEKAEKLIEEIAKGDRPVSNAEVDPDAPPRGGTWGSETKINMRTSTSEDE